MHDKSLRTSERETRKFQSYYLPLLRKYTWISITCPLWNKPCFLSHALIVMSAVIICNIPTYNFNTPLFSTCFISNLNKTLLCQRLIGLWNSCWRLCRRYFLFLYGYEIILNYGYVLWVLLPKDQSKLSVNQIRKIWSSHIKLVASVGQVWFWSTLPYNFHRVCRNTIRRTYFFSVNGVNWLIYKPRQNEDVYGVCWWFN